ncbi:MAG: protein rep [Proteobacteria bacterium]|nr:protein rep [Pseudomonadota bacterium]
MSIVKKRRNCNNFLEKKELYCHSDPLEFSSLTKDNYKYKQKNNIVNDLDKIDYHEAFGKYWVSPQGLIVSDLIQDLEKMKKCSSNMVYQYNVGNLKQYKTVFSNSCGLNYCPICAKKRRSRIMAQTFPVIKKLEGNKMVNWYMVTISEKNTKDLRGAFSSLRESWERFYKKGQKGRIGEVSKFAGYIMSMEYVKSGAYYNVHAHIMVCCKEENYLDYVVYGDYTEEKKKYGKYKVPPSILKKYSLALRVEDKKECGRCRFGGECLGKGGVDPWKNIEHKRTKVPFCDNLKSVSKIGHEWYLSTKEKGKNIDVQFLKKKGSVQRKDGTFKTIKSMGDNLSEVLKYITKITDMDSFELVLNYVDLKGLKLLSRGGVFTNYKSGKKLLEEMSGHLKKEDREKIEQGGKAESLGSPQSLIQINRNRDDKIIIPKIIDYDAYVLAQKRSHELCSLQGKAIGASKKQISEAFKQMSSDINSMSLGENYNAVEIFFKKKYIEFKESCKKALSEYLSRIIVLYKEDVYNDLGLYDPGFDKDDPELDYKNTWHAWTYKIAHQDAG